MAWLEKMDKVLKSELVYERMEEVRDGYLAFQLESQNHHHGYRYTPVD